MPPPAVLAVGKGDEGEVNAIFPFGGEVALCAGLMSGVLTKALLVE